MKVLKKAIILIIIVIFTINIIPTKSLLVNASNSIIAEYYDTQTQTLYVGDIPIEVFVRYRYSKDNYNMKQVTSISSVSASIHASQYSGFLSEYHTLNGNTINVTVYGSAHIANNYSDIVNIYRIFTFNIS